ncbi:MAG: acyltransferase [Terriglobia bacterium]
MVTAQAATQPGHWKNSRIAGRITEIDGLRGFAILLVLFYHYVTPIGAPRLPGWSLVTQGSRMFWSGVDLFFVLSGFLIAGILLDSARSPNYFKTFYLRRIHRIFALYYIWVAPFYLGVWLDLDRKLGTFLFRGSVSLWMYPLFLQNNAPLWFNAELPGWMAMSWSLAVEEQFYLILPAVIRVVNRVSLAWICGSVIVLSPVYRTFLVAGNPQLNPGWTFATLARLDGLAMGIAVALLVRDKSCWTWIIGHGQALRAVGIISLPVFFLLTYFATTQVSMAAYGFSLIALICAVLLLLGISQPDSGFSAVLRAPLLRYFGRISFAVYIVHQGVHGMLMDGLIPAWSAHLSSLRMITVTILSLAVTLALAEISWRFMESKLIRRAHVRYKY